MKSPVACLLCKVPWDLGERWRPVVEGVGMSHRASLLLGGDAKGGQHHVGALHLNRPVVGGDGVDTDRG